MAEFKISRIRYTWRNEWVSATNYNKDDVIRYGGSTWVCVRQHTASAFQTDQDYLANPSDSEATPAWKKMTDGYAFRGNWGETTLYNAGDLVVYGGVIYLTNTSHTSASTFLPNAEKFTEHTSLINWLSDWAPATRYGVGDLVRYNGTVLRCISEHTSGSEAEGTEIGNNDTDDDSTGERWENYYEGIEYTGDWVADTRYRVNDLAKFGGTVYRCIVGNTASSYLETDSEHWQIEFQGFNFYSEWSAAVYYGAGDVVRHGGHNFIAGRFNTNSNPSRSLYDQPFPLSDWSIIAKGIRLRGDWSADVLYKTGDLVRRGGYLYRAIVDNEFGSDGSSLDYLDESNWERILEGNAWRQAWEVGDTFSIGELIIYKGNLYECNFGHIATENNFPGDNGSGFDYWDLVIQAGPNVALNVPGDLLSFGLNRTATGDLSSLGTLAVPVGEDGELLNVNALDTLGYRTDSETLKVVYVAPDGVDTREDPRRGFSPYRPWGSIAYACEQIELLGDDSIRHTVQVATGEYNEILPIIVPKQTAVNGNELRSVTVKPNKSLVESGDDVYIKAAIDYFSQIIDDILELTPIDAQTGNTNQQVTDAAIIGIEDVPLVPAQIDPITLLPLVDNAIPASMITAAQDRLADAKNYIDFYINSGDTDPVLTGTVTAPNTNVIRNALRIVDANKKFLIDQLYNYIVNTYPDYTFNNYHLNTITKFVDNMRKDINLPGNYYTIRAARYYKNINLGSGNDDMFYCRDASGVRNLTTKDLEGTLNPPNVFELYRRPTGGAYCSLDPGWGPDDSSTWILTRSPYIQNVTTVGTNCVGQKIDGALHNGGNKSIVSNDFTQVISDGIGAWVLNNGRAELVSVFTYYAQIGMFAEKGGVIRATNGNSSYGDFGSVADGNDPTEIPKYAEVNTRTGQAKVAAAFAGEVNDEILALEFSNAGQNYTYATYNISGAGVNASVRQEEFRDDAVFEALVKTAPGDAGATIGGQGYSQIGNNAQRGTATSITLATNDSSTEAKLLGLRLIITSGKGAGQYGYVTSYDEITKIVQVARESDDVAGWDHIISGTPAQPVLFTDNTYRFEPRPSFSHPGYTASIENIGASDDWGAVLYSETEEVYTSIAGSVGSGEVIDVTPVTALWTVTKIGRSYTVVNIEPGAGYEEGQEITIDGSNIGGVDQENDIIITVTGTTEDSTNSITGFRHVGTAASGRFVVLTAAGDAVTTSIDADAWTVDTLPSTGNWSAAAAGGKRFVALKRSSSDAIWSSDGISWNSVSLPVSRNWSGVAWGSNNELNNGYGVFLAVAENFDTAVYSTDGGESWSQTTIPDIGDSTFNQWVDVAYGGGNFVAICNTGNFNAKGTYVASSDTWTWDTHVMDVIDDSTTKDWYSVTYGNNRFVALSSTGDVGYSFNGESWNPATMPSQDGSTAHFWRMIRYGQGVFFAIGDTGDRLVGGDTDGAASRYCATSYDGQTWTERELAQESEWRAIGFGNPDISLGDSTTQSNSTGIWIAVAKNLDHASKQLTGARALGRCIVETGSIKEVRLWEPGSGYQSNPSITITDPSNTADAYVEMRMGDAVLAQPSWITRGQGFRTSSTITEVLGDGFADVIPNDQTVTVSGLTVLPGPGAQFRFRGETGFYTVNRIRFQSTQIDATLTAEFDVSPKLTLAYFLEHSSQVEIRERYSQVRITGHDFLDVGTGNFVETNYPKLYTEGTFQYAAENEVVELNGGRVFYTSTDQSGNFRCGELFAVEQATGIVTISADFFDLGGLTELALGGVRLGGSGAVVREFSTDPLFIQDSNNVVPTQRAIASFLQNRLNVGGSDLLTASFVAGTVRVGPDLIGSSAGLKVVFPGKVDFFGPTAGIAGSMLAQTMFHNSFYD